MNYEQHINDKTKYVWSLNANNAFHDINEDYSRKKCKNITIAHLPNLQIYDDLSAIKINGCPICLICTRLNLFVHACIYSFHCLNFRSLQRWRLFFPWYKVRGFETASVFCILILHVLFLVRILLLTVCNFFL